MAGTSGVNNSNSGKQAISAAIKEVAGQTVSAKVMKEMTANIARATSLISKKQ